MPFWSGGRPVTVEGGEGTAPGAPPLAFWWRGRRQWVREAVLHWRLHCNWWRGERWRDYWAVTTESGYLCVLYRDRLEGGRPEDGWYLERVYE